MDETAVRGFDARVAVFPARRQTSRAADERTVCVHYGGREFRCRPESAQIFLRRAMLVAHHHETELVALVHEDGLELLLITDAMPLSIGTTEPSRPRSLQGFSVEPPH